MRGSPKISEIGFILLLSAVLLSCGDRQVVVVSFDQGAPEVVEKAPTLCVERIGAGAQVVVAGSVVVTPTRVIANGAVAYDRNSGLILCVGTDCLADIPEDATVLCSQGLIFPALIDTHNHVPYNILPRWEHEEIYQNRYDWQGDKSYKAFKQPYGDLKGAGSCAMALWGEVRAAVGGAGSIQGSTSRTCTRGFIRNVEESYSNFLDLPSFRERVTSVNSMKSKDAVKIASGLSEGTVQAFIVHLAEGIDSESRAELETLKGFGLLRAGTAIIHGTALDPEGLSELAAAGSSLIWSPRSNIDLYGRTTDIPTAMNLGINIALAPDWTPSGSRNMLREIKCARQLSDQYYGGMITDKSLVYMATVQAAAALRVESRIGSLAPGLLADILVIEGNPDAPFAALVGASEFNIKLLTVGGRAIYGSAEMMTPIEPMNCETINICGFDKRLCLKETGDEESGVSTLFADLEKDLEGALVAAAQAAVESGELASFVADTYRLFPLVGCGPEAATGEECIFHGYGLPDGATSDDKDADGVDDSVDICPDIFDPGQWDRDQDNLGDACDPCPVQAGVTDCPRPSILDRDQDGILLAEDNCPFLPNADQADADNDGIGDICDRCPTWSNLSWGGCPVSVISVRDPAQPDHPDQGTRVVVQNVVVTGIRKGGAGAYMMIVQAPTAASHGGIEVNLGDIMPTVQVGELVDVTGTYIEYYEVSQLTDGPVVVSKGVPSSPITPLEVSVGEIWDEGGLAEAYESMLVRVVDVEVVDDNPDKPKDFGEFAIWEVGISPPSQGGLRVDDYLSGVGSHPAKGTRYAHIIGIAGYSYGHRKIYPRSQNDLATAGP